MDLDNGLEDIQLNRNEFSSLMVGGTSGTKKPTTKPKGSYRKHVCLSCGLIARTTKDANIVCGDCGVEMEKGA